MESEQEEVQIEYNIKEINKIKKKENWDFLSDIESLISQLNSEKKVSIVYDTETTGLNHKKGHILELAAVEVENFKLTGKIMHIYIKPRVFVPKNIKELNHIKYDDYQKFWEHYNQDTKSQLQNFLHFIGNDSYLIAHNATFDYYFLMDELKYWKLPEIPKERFRCTLRIAKIILKLKGKKIPSLKLHDACDCFGVLVNRNEGSFHNGLFDATMTFKLFIRLNKNYININDNDAFQKYQKKNNEEKNDIIEKIEKINLNDREFGMEQDECIDNIDIIKQDVEDLKKKSI